MATRTAATIVGLRRRLRRGRTVATVLAPALATGVGLLIGESRTTAAALVYLLAVLSVAVVAGAVPGMVASALSFVGLNYFFTPPRRLLAVDKTDDLIALLVFVAAGVVASALVDASLTFEAQARRREQQSTRLYAMTTSLASGDIESGARELAGSIRALLDLAGCEIVVRDAEGARSVVTADGDPAGTPVELPLTTAGGDVGVLRLYPGARGLEETDRRIAVVFARQLAAAIERATLERAAGDALAAAETNRIRRALLSAVSHDLRTPLASIKASITALTSEAAEGMPAADRTELLETAREETERLERLVTNLLDLTRIRSGTIAPDRIALPVQDLIDDALRSLGASLEAHEVTVAVRPDTPNALVDPVQAGQVVRNVIENAAKYSPPGTDIRVTAARWQRAVEVRVSDRGPGVPEAEREAVFQEFYRGGDGDRPGSGIGLAVAKAIVSAHGGQIWIEGTPGGGATAVIRFPAEADAAA